MSNLSIELKQLFVSTPTEAIIRSDGQGNIIDTIHAQDIDPAFLAEGIDITLASFQQFARTLSLGDTLVTMQMCEQGVVFSSRHHEGGVVTVVTNNTSNIGIILSLMRRLGSKPSVQGQ